MTVPSVHCEARKIAYRQTRDGLVVSFVIHPNDMPGSLATAPLGQRYMLALAQIGDDEQVIPASPRDVAERPAAPVLADHGVRGEPLKYGAATTKEWQEEVDMMAGELPVALSRGQSLGAVTDERPVTQSPALGNASDSPTRDEPPFAGYDGGEWPSPRSPRSSRAKAAYAQGTPGEQAVTRAALLCKDEQFVSWLQREYDFGDEPLACGPDIANALRDLLDIASRSELASDPEALNRFLAMELQYKLDTGALPEMRG